MSKADYEYGFSEDEDDPYQSSGSEWNSDKELVPVRKNSRRSSRVPNISSKKLRLESSSSDSDEYEEDPQPRRRNGNGVNKKLKVSSDEVATPEPARVVSPKLMNSKDFSTGSFLIAKKDANVGDPAKHPCIWRVDGKALLQKYEPFENEGRISHKTTSIYTGWSALDQDLYAPVTVTVKQHSNQNLIVDLNWEKLKEMINESDE